MPHTTRKEKKRMNTVYIACVLFVYVEVSVAPPASKDVKEQLDGLYNLDGLTPEQAHNQEYFRYISQVVGELEKDPAFAKKMENMTEDDIKSGKVAEIFDVVGHNVRRKMDEIKRMEVEYQRDLIRQNKHHMADYSKSYWNPVHHDNKETFEKDDFMKLLRRHSDMIEEINKQRHQEFQTHELEKERQRREAMKNMTAEEKDKEEKHHEETHHKEHEKIHQPGHKAQLEEVWEKEDGYDPESFDPRTFFNLHDKNSDGFLDYYEIETLFIHDLDKVYNLSDPEVDYWEREEELERMRSHLLKTMDDDKDGLLSLEEFIRQSKKDEFGQDEEWKPLTEEDQFTEAEYAEYERMIEDVKFKKALEEMKDETTDEETTKEHVKKEDH